MFSNSDGLLGIFENYGAYQRWVRTTSSRAQMYKQMLDLCGMISDPDCPKGAQHRDLEKAQIQMSETAVQKILTAISHFTNPWRVPNKDYTHWLLVHQYPQK